MGDKNVAPAKPAIDGLLDSVYRKSSATNTLLLYLLRREVWESSSKLSKEELENNSKRRDNPYEQGIVEGVIVLVPEYLKDGQKVFVEVVALYTYNKSELGQFDLNVRRFVFRAYQQVYPVVEGGDTLEFSKMTNMLKTKLGMNSYAFKFNIIGGPNSVLVYDMYAPHAKNGISWEIRAYIDYAPNIKPPLDDFVQMKIRKLTFIPPKFNELVRTPSKKNERKISTCCGAGGTVILQTELNKAMYEHNEDIELTVKIDNLSNRSLEKIKVTIDQEVLLELLQVNSYNVRVKETTFSDRTNNMPIAPGAKNWKMTVVIIFNPQTINEAYNVVLEPPSNLDHLDLSQTLLASSSLNEEQIEKICKRSKTFKETGVSTEETPPIRQPPRVTGNVYCECPIHVSYKVTVQCEMPVAFGLLGNGPKNTMDLILTHSSPVVGAPRVTIPL